MVALRVPKCSPYAAMDNDLELDLDNPRSRLVVLGP